MALIFNGERLKKARLYRGMTVSDLAESLGLSKQAISQYETGKTQPEKIKLFDISSVLGFPYSYFYQADTLSIVPGTTYFRSLLSTTKKERVQQYYIIEYLSLIYSFLSKYVDFPKNTIPSITEDNSANPEHTAESIRALWKLGSGPIEDMTYVLESHGIVVTYLSTEHHNIDAYSQLLTFDGEQRFFVVLSSDKNSASRTQFDAAHELGHILLHTWSEDIESLSHDEFKDREKQAHSFAAALLLPKASFLQDLSGHENWLDHYITLKKKWKVSISCMLMRAYHLGAITTNQYQYMMRQLSARGWRTREPLDETLELKGPSSLKEAVGLLLDNDVFTPSSFLTEFSSTYAALTGTEVERLLSLPPGTLSIEPLNHKTLSMKIKPATSDMC